MVLNLSVESLAQAAKSVYIFQKLFIKSIAFIIWMAESFRISSHLLLGFFLLQNYFFVCSDPWAAKSPCQSVYISTASWTENRSADLPPQRFAVPFVFKLFGKKEKEKEVGFT